MNIEAKLARYSGYESESYERWASQLSSNSLAEKIVSQINILTSRDIRELLRKTVSKNRKLIETDNSYFCSFGPVWKSGAPVLYEFGHAVNCYSKKILENSYDLSGLPDGSKIFFLDDLVGTGKQSVDYINTKLNLLLNPSHKTFLMCLCATRIGMEYVHENTNTRVIPCLILEENKWLHFQDNCKVFDPLEKKILRQLNTRLHDPEKGYYGALGLLLAFYFAVPNNTMPFIWKDNASYKDSTGAQKKWASLLPRRY